MFFHVSASSFGCGAGLVWAVILTCLFFGGLFVHPVSTYQQSKGLLPLRSAGGATGRTFPCAKHRPSTAMTSPIMRHRMIRRLIAVDFRLELGLLHLLGFLYVLPVLTFSDLFFPFCRGFACPPGKGKADSN